MLGQGLSPVRYFAIFATGIIAIEPFAALVRLKCNTLPESNM